MNDVGVIAAIVAVFVLFAAVLVIVIIRTRHSGRTDIVDIPKSPERIYGERGERIAGEVLRDLMKEGDCLLENVSISYDGKSAEIDKLVINSNGVFIIEVKNYAGELFGGEDDQKWTKRKEDGGGNVFLKIVDNPIKQVKRQKHIFANYLRENGVDVWVSGYVLLVHQNSPVESEFILSNREEIDRKIHSPGRKTLSKDTIENIRKLCF